MAKKQNHLNFNQSAPNLTVQTIDGETIQLSSFWTGKTLLLAFIRHFGCPQCKEMLSKLVALKPQLEKVGISIAIVTQGTPIESRAFCEQYAPGLRCLSDTQRQVYEAYGVERGNLRQTLFSRRVWAANARARKTKGWKPELPPTGQDAMLMSAVFIIGSDGYIRLPYYYDNIADHPPVELLLKGFLDTSWHKPLESPMISVK
jgi:peroxiredoxin